MKLDHVKHAIYSRNSIVFYSPGEVVNSVGKHEESNEIVIRVEKIELSI